MNYATVPSRESPAKGLHFLGTGDNAATYERTGRERSVATQPPRLAEFNLRMKVNNPEDDSGITGHYSALQNDRPVFGQVGQEFFIYTLMRNAT